jgi:PhnB protein
MATNVKPIPDGYHAITPYLIVNGAAKAIDYYQRAFGASEIMRLAGPDGKVGHAEVQVGDSKIMLADEHPQMDAKGPAAYGGSPVSLHLYVADVDTVFNRAVAAGATVDRPVENKFYGDRAGSLTDPFGHTWTVSTHVEDVSEEEIHRRMSAMFSQPAEAPAPPPAKRPSAKPPRPRARPPVKPARQAARARKSRSRARAKK